MSNSITEMVGGRAGSAGVVMKTILRRITELVALIGLVVFLQSCYGGYAVYSEPPPPQVEVIGVTPAPGYVWVAGRWNWRGGWAWQPGRWEAPPAPNASYVHGYWLHHNNGYHYVEGHWHERTEQERQEPERHDDRGNKDNRGDNVRKMGEGH